MSNKKKYEGEKEMAESRKIKFIVEGKACGKLTGGNLSIICSSLGTDNEIDTNNKNFSTHW